MIKKIIIAFSVVLGLYCLQSCGQETENDPQAVAEAAVKCYQTDDFVAMKGLLDPMDENGQSIISQREEINAYTSGNHKDLRFSKLRDSFDSAVKQAVFLDSEGAEYVVSVRNKNGQWYLDRYENF